MASSNSDAVAAPAPATQFTYIPMPILLKEDNYVIWKPLIIPRLKMSDLLKIAEGTEQCPPQFLTTENKAAEEKQNPAYTDWNKRDQTLLSLIHSSISIQFFHKFVTKHKSGQAMWLSLETWWSTEGYPKAVERYREKLRKLKLIDIYSCHRRDYIDSCRRISIEGIKYGVGVDDDEFVSGVLKGLPSPYFDELKASIRYRPKPVSRSELFDLIENHHPTRSTWFLGCFGACFRAIGTYSTKRKSYERAEVSE